MAIRDNVLYINKIKNEASERIGKKGDDVLLVAVTKLHPPIEINEAIDAGITDIGENKVQEILDKYGTVKPVRWHLIGHLQTNKVKQIIDKVYMIHSVDSYHLAEEIEKRAAQKNLSVNILIQVNPAREESKFGIDLGEVDELIDKIIENCPHISIKGFMCIAPFYDDPEDTRPVFAEMRKLFQSYKNNEREDKRLEMKYLSMGMSSDFEIAIEEGANLIRVGTAIFGNRDYRSEER